MKFPSTNQNMCAAQHWDDEVGIRPEHEPDEGFDKLNMSITHSLKPYVQLHICKNCGCLYGDANFIEAKPIPMFLGVGEEE